MATSINTFNENFYKHAKPKLIDNLPNLFTKLDLFNIALHAYITKKLNQKSINLIELASGKKMDRWKTFGEIDNDHSWKILLTDFDKSLLPKVKNTYSFKFKTGIYSLFNTFPKLKKIQKRDAMLSTYTFDNLWLKGDLHLIKLNNVWYKSLYKISRSKILTKKTKINLKSLKYGLLIEKYYKNHNKVSVNYPGGLIRKAKEAFKNQLKKEGFFITADIATVKNNAKAFQSVNKSIQIKIENYALAKYILEKIGFKVELKNLYEFIKEAQIATPVKIYDHFVLSITQDIS